MLFGRRRLVAVSFLAVLALTGPGPRAVAQDQSTPSPPDSDAAAVLPVSGGGPTVEIANGGTVTFHADHVSLATALRLLSIKARRNIVASSKVGGTVTANIYDATFEEALNAILMPNHAGYRIYGDFIYIYTRDELEEMKLAEHPLRNRVFHLNYISAADAAAIVTPMLSDDGRISVSPPAETGIGSNADQAGGDSLALDDVLVVHDAPEQLAEIARVIRDIDVRPRQVLVEATILSAQLTDDNALGIDFTLLGGVDLQMLGSTSVGVQDLTLGPLPVDRFDDGNVNVSTDFPAEGSNGGLQIGLIVDHVGVFLRALERVTDTTVLANPSILALNKQRAQVIVGRRDGFITTTVTQTQAIQKVEFLETGTQLILRPFIGDDGFVRMELHPEDSIGGLTAANLPFEQTTEVTTNVLVRDGHTILIGGLFREVSKVSRSQVPLLGDIPAAGTLFQSRSDNTNRQEVIILLTVHIIKDHDAYAAAGSAVAEDIERIRVGLRRGMMWHGRERLAQAHYRGALAQYANGATNTALWNLRMALHNAPHLVGALKLKEEILQRRDWDEDGAATRGFINRLIRQEQGVDRPLFGRPAWRSSSGDAAADAEGTEAPP